jgi:hypothetical protein
MNRTHTIVFLLAGALSVLPCGAAAGAPREGGRRGESAPDLASPPAVLPALRSAALDHKFRLEGVDPFMTGRKLNAGDSVTALITTSKGAHFRQWLVEMKVVSPSSGGAGRVDTGEVIYTATGDRVQFRSGLAQMRLRILGPVSDTAGADAGHEDCPESSVSASAHEDLLRIGADGLCRVILRFSKVGQSPSIGFSTAPFTPAEIAEGKQAADAAGVTRDDELAFAGGAEVLDEFIDDAEDIPGILSIATQGVDWPSVWTMLFKMNFTTRSVIDWRNTSPVESSLLGSSAQVYRLPFDLYMFGSHISRGGWFVTAPESPLTASGGVVGAWLQSVKHPENRIFMSVISAHRGMPLAGH